METSSLVFVMVDEDGDKARRLQRDYLRQIGVEPGRVSDDEYRAATARHFVGTPDDVAADLHRRVLDPGVDGIINLVPNGHEPGVVRWWGRCWASCCADHSPACPWTVSVLRTRVCSPTPATHPRKALHT